MNGLPDPGHVDSAHPDFETVARGGHAPLDYDRRRTPAALHHDLHSLVGDLRSRPAACSAFAGLDYDPLTGNPAIVHVGDLGKVVRYLRWNGTSWEPAEIVDAGSYCAIKFNSSGTACVSYRASGELRVAKRLAVDSYEMEVVEERSFSWQPSLAIDPDDPNELPSVAYFENADDDLKYARRNL